LRAVTFKTTNENPTESFTTRTIVWKTDDGTYLGGWKWGLQYSYGNAN